METSPSSLVSSICLPRFPRTPAPGAGSILGLRILKLMASEGLPARDDARDEAAAFLDIDQKSRIDVMHHERQDQPHDDVVDEPHQLHPQKQVDPAKYRRPEPSVKWQREEGK